MKALLLMSIFAISLNLNTGDCIEKEIKVKADEEVSKTIEIKEGDKTYELELNEILEKTDINETKTEKVYETKEFIVNTNDKDKILKEYKELEHKSDNGVGVLEAKDIISLVENNYYERYWETTESINRTIETTTENIDNIPRENLLYTVDGKTYEMLSAELTPIEFVDNKPVKWEANGVWTTIIPNYEKIPIEWKVQIAYEGEIKTDEKVGENVIAEYKVVNINKDKNFQFQWRNIIPPTFGATLFILIGFLSRANIIVKSDNRRLKGYRKISKDKIELDLYKEFKISNDLELTIKKSLSKKLNNTHFIIKNKDKIVYDTILNSEKEPIKIKIGI